MTRKPLALLVAFVVTSPAMAQAAADSGGAASGAAPVFSSQQNVELFYCTALTDTAKGLAARRLQGATAAEAKRREYPDAGMKEVYDAIVDKVYEDAFADSWEYAVGFFGYCARDIAKVSKAQADFGARCYQNLQIAADTVDLRQQGLSRKEVSKRLSAIKNETSGAVFEKTWAADKERSDAMDDAWRDCMAPVTRD